MVIVGVPRDRDEGETRVALTPEKAKKLLKDGHTVCVETGAGVEADWPDESYREAGCEVVDSREEVVNRADVVLHVNGLGAADECDPEMYREGQVVVGILGPSGIDDEEYDVLAENDVSAFALELMPRISRAQSMDVLSSMASISGYKATIDAAQALPKLFPMQMTAAGTVKPAEVFVVGAGVAGLQAIATAERLDASVRAYDIRPEVSEEVESLGADFVELDLEADDASDEEGHATHQDEEFYRKQRKMMTRVVAESDVVITTAAIPGQPAPELVTNEMIEGMDDGSVIVDLAAETGGNCEPTEADDVVEYEGVEVYGPTNLPATVAHTASDLLSNNLRNFVEYITEDGELEFDLSDEVISSTLLTHDGEKRMPHRKDASVEEEEETAEDADAAGESGDEAEADEAATGDADPDETEETDDGDTGDQGADDGDTGDQGADDGDSEPASETPDEKEN